MARIGVDRGRTAGLIGGTPIAAVGNLLTPRSNGPRETLDPRFSGGEIPRRDASSRVAQVVEQVTVNHRVGGSSPSSGAVIRLAAASIYRNGHLRKGVPVLLLLEFLVTLPRRFRSQSLGVSTRRLTKEPDVFAIELRRARVTNLV